MKLIFVLFIALLCTGVTYCQGTFKAIIKDSKTNEPLTGATATLLGTTKGGITDTSGLVSLVNIPEGKQIIQYRYVGYVTRIDTLTFPLASDEPLLIAMDLTGNTGEELNEVVVASTRSSRTIATLPTRVEVISGEELEEKGNMKPGDIRMLLAESTGIQTQQTSATSGNSSIRIQGLDGKYTQIIRDGFPLYSGFSGGLGLLQIAPLDLKQVEVIKGSSSTLYGGGAIAGLVNLVSKTPMAKPQLNLLLNGTSALGLDASTFYSERSKRIGITIYTAFNHGTPYDPAGIGLTAIPRFNRFTLNPKLFLYVNDKTTVNFGINSTIERRLGGNIDFITGKTDNTLNPYFERNNTDRYSTQGIFEHEFNDKSRLTVKNSLSYFDRSIILPGYIFAGTQFTTYSEATYTYRSEKSDWIFGTNYLTDAFSERNHASILVRDYRYHTAGGFIQNTWNATDKFTLETGLRGDLHNKFGFFALPRISGLYKINPHLSTRLGGGLGYKAPTVFTEDAERIQFRNVLPIDVGNTKAERSYGANYDINYNIGLFNNQVSLSVNQMFFYTRVERPILLTPLLNGYLQYQQPSGDLNTKGLETNIKLTYADFKLFIGYTFADVNEHTGDFRYPYPLVSKHRLNNVLVYEIEDKWKIGLEAYYFSPQHLNDNTIGRSYWTAGLMAEHTWKRLALFINFENLTDIRQTKFGTIYTGSIGSPTFKDIYAPLDGFVVNGGIKFKVF